MHVYNTRNSFRSNILLEEHLGAKLADFNFSFRVPEKVDNITLISAVHGLPGTNGYRPPEFNDSNFSVYSDMYSFGVVSCSADICNSTLNFIACITGSIEDLYWIIGICG